MEDPLICLSVILDTNYFHKEPNDIYNIWEIQ